MSELDEKLTILHKKFHFLEPGIISDILQQVGLDLPLATEFLSAMITDDERSQTTKSPEATEIENDADLQKVLELSKREENEKTEVLKILELEDEKFRNNSVGTFEDIAPDPPPEKQKMDFATKLASKPPYQPVNSMVNRTSFSPPIDYLSRSDVKDGYNLYIMRGLPGSGKSSLAQQIAKSYHDHGKRSIISSADDTFLDIRTNQYNFDVTRLDEAHHSCRAKAEKHMKKVSIQTV